MPQISTSSVVGTNSTVTMASYLMPSGYPNITTIPAGIWSTYLHMYRLNSNPNTLEAFADFYSRDTSGNETFLFGTDPVLISNITTPVMIDTDTYQPGNYSLSTTDRILMKVKVRNTNLVFQNTAYLVSEGTEHYSFVQTTLGILGASSGTSGVSGSSGSTGSSGTSGSSGSSGVNGISSNGPQNYVQVLGSQVGSISTIGSTIISGSISTTGGPVKIMVTGDANPQSVTGWVRLQIYRDNTPIGNIIQAETSGNNVNVPYCLDYIDNPSTGTYVYSMRTVSGISGTFQFGEVNGPTLTIVELTGSGTSGTSGIAPTSLSLSETLTVSGTASFNGLTVLHEVTEIINSTPGATASTVVYDFTTGSNWYHSSINTNYTANFTNIPTTNNRAITATIVMSQSSTAYMPTAVQINGSGQQIRWAGGTASGTPNQVDIVGFTFIRSGNVWAQVLGQINTFD